jgi:hypothetical protein
VRAGGEHRHTGREDRGRTDTGQRLPGEQDRDPRGVPGLRAGREEAERRTHCHQQCADREQSLAAEQIADDTEAQFEQRDRDQERIRYPGQLGGRRAEIELEQPVQHRWDRQSDLGDRDGEGRGEQRATGQTRSAFGGPDGRTRNVRHVCEANHSQAKLYRFPDH